VTNNDILRRIRYTFAFNDSKMIEIFKHVEYETNREEISNWLKQDNHEDYVSCGDVQFASFLNGFIIEKRGKQDGALPVAEKVINNNIVLRKLKIALNLKNEDVLTMLAVSGLVISKHELSAFFRRPDHKHFRSCKDQVLRNFLQSMQRQVRPNTDPDEE